MTTKYTKPATGKTAATPQTPVFPKEIHHPRPSVVPVTNGKAPKRDNIFSKSRDIREDRDARQVKTSQNNQTLPHGRT
jgi:hypothetical protein